jgi:hypothetical protein
LKDSEFTNVKSCSAVLVILTDIAVSLKTSDREGLQIHREAAMATFYTSPDPQG